MSNDELILTSIPKENLISSITESVVSRMEKKLSSMLPDKKRVKLSRKDTADRMDCSLPTLDKHTRDGLLKRYKQGGRYFYYEDEIDNAYIEMENRRTKY